MARHCKVDAAVGPTFEPQFLNKRVRHMAWCFHFQDLNGANAQAKAGMQLQKCIYTHSSTHTSAHTHTHTHTQLCMRACLHTHMHRYKHVRTRVRTPARAQEYTRACTPKRIPPSCSIAPPFMQARTSVRTHAHPCPRTYAPPNDHGATNSGFPPQWSSHAMLRSF